MPTPFKASIITPEAIVLETSVTAAQVPAFDGLIGILHLRAPLLAKLGTGVLRLDTDVNSQQRFLVSGGYAQVKDDVLTILTDEAIPASQITPALVAAEEAKLHAGERDSSLDLDKRNALRARIQAMRQIIQ